MRQVVVSSYIIQPYCIHIGFLGERIVHRADMHEHQLANLAQLKVQTVHIVYCSVVCIGMAARYNLRTPNHAAHIPEQTVHVIKM
jgi:hypothetical protein